MEIELTKLLTGECYFEITIGDDVYSTSEEISEILNLDLDTYNRILANKIVRHKNYVMCMNGSIDVYKDLVFDLCNIPEETYIDRFKETFTEQLTLLALGGV